MKLTRAQRLFIAAGQVQNELMLQKYSFAPWDDGKEESGNILRNTKPAESVLSEPRWRRGSKKKPPPPGER